MFAREFHRSGRWHPVALEFRLTEGPTIITVTSSIIVIGWTMSEIASGRLEWGYSAGALTNTTTLTPLSSGLETFVHTITGLTAATPVYIRTRSISAAGLTVYSSVFTVTTSGTVSPPSGIGPRYDEYGAGQSGNFPTFPTGGNVVVAPASIRQASDVGGALGTWISAQANNAVMVLDDSGSGSYGPGREYVISDNVNIHLGNGALRSGQKLWMHNTRIRSTATGDVGVRGSNKRSVILWFEDGGHQDLEIHGGTLQGANTAAGTWACRSLGPETGHGILITNYQGLVIRDLRIRQVMGDFINLGQADVTTARYNVGWQSPQGIEQGWVRYQGSGRQGVVPNRCYGFWMHHFEIKDTALSGIDNEDNIVGPSGFRWIRAGLLEDGIFDGWTWHLVTGSTPGWSTWAIQFSTDDAECDMVDDWTYRRLTFKGGHKGWGNPAAEIAVLGSVQNGGAGNGGVHVGAFPPPHHDLARTPTKTNLTFVDNVFQLPTDQRNGYALNLLDWAGTNTVTDNDLQGLPVRARSTSGLTFLRNGTSQLVTT